MEKVIGSKSDFLQKVYPDVANTMMLAFSHRRDIERKVAELLDDKVWFDDGEHPNLPFTNFHMLKRINSWFIHGFVRIEDQNFFNNLRWPCARRRYSLLIEANNLSAVGQCMKNRMTSKLEDEPVCLATLLGQDPKDILEESIQERTKLVVSLIGYVSTFLIFSPCARIDEEAYR